MGSLVLVGICKDQLFVQRLFVFVIGQCAVVVHLPEHILLPAAVLFLAGVDPLSGGIVGVAGKGVERLRTLGNGCQTRCLCHVQLAGALAEIFLGGVLNAVGASAESDVVQIGFQNLVLGVGSLQLHGTEDLTNLTGGGLFAVAGDVFDELLGDGRTALIGVIDVNEHVHES